MIQKKQWNGRVEIRQLLDDLMSQNLDKYTQVSGLWCVAGNLAGFSYIE